MGILNPIRPRRNRRDGAIRSLVRENHLTKTDLIMPLFVAEENQDTTEIQSMPGIYRYPLNKLPAEVENLYNLGIKAVALFPVIDEDQKDRKASASHQAKGLNIRAIGVIKKTCPEMVVISDVAMDPYSSDGHDGLLSKEGEVLNDETLPILAKMAVMQAQAGADYVAPSDMMDGRVGYIRHALDKEGLENTGILSYSAKYASAFYGPFRDALDSAPKRGDKKTYQMDSANAREAVREVALDIEEGADIVMIKPGLSYLDIIERISSFVDIPVAAYNVSGEYAMVKAASENGWINYEEVMLEILTSFKRAGSDLIFTYHAKDAAKIL